MSDMDNTRRLWAYPADWRDTTSNAMLVNSFTMSSLRHYYRRMRRNGASRFMARSVIWNTLFDAMLNKPTFVVGVEVAS